jgi:hypothetical protein
MATLLIYPVLDIFRLMSLGVDVNIETAKDSILGNFKLGHLDAFQSIMMAIEFDKYTFGYSFLGAILFFIPRVYWENKPIGSGEMIANDLGLSFNNISMSLPGEFFISYDIIGVFIISMFFGNLLAIVDKVLVNSRAPERVYSILFVPLVFIIMRGDLITGISFSLGILFSVYFWHKILTIKLF